MTQLPIKAQSPDQQQLIMEQLYALMEKQVRSYHTHRHMGSNSSVPVELAQELIESIEYTANQVGGIYAHPSVEQALRLGQEVLENKHAEAKSMLELVTATAPHWQTECRWDAIHYLRHYLDCYDHLHLAHEGPDNLFYPILISPPEDIRGIDMCLFYLNILWIENQIMAGVEDDALEAFWDRLPTATLNQCEHLLLNGIGKAMIGAGLEPLTFLPEEQMRLMIAMLNATEEDLKSAASLLCHWLNLKDENTKTYVFSVISQLILWIGNNTCDCDIVNLFI